MLRIGLDIHGTIDTKPKFFAIFSKRVISNNGEIHIITGSRQTPEIEQQLKDLGIQYTHFFSIADYLLSQGKEVFWKTPNDPFFSDADWNIAKANYCDRNQIDIHFDDSLEYGKYFKTLYMRII